MFAKKVEIHGHRGARGLYPENSIKGFIEAVKLGVDAIEMDVVISRDGKVVVSHEPWMNPKICTTPEGLPVKWTTRKNIFKMDYERVKQYDCGKRVHPDFPQQQPSPQYKPLLSEVIEKIEKFISENKLQKVQYNIEIKSSKLTDNRFHPTPEKFAKIIFDTISTFKIDNRIMIQSFDKRVLKAIHNLDKNIQIGMLVFNSWSLNYHLKKLGFTPYAYNPSYKSLKEKNLQEAHKMGIKLFIWTVNEVSEMKKVIEMGVDGIITDYPDRAVMIQKK
ncbi:MAG: glycerophosphodiester phosphodiesterase family protein [Bacteroidia bacterium]